MALTFGPEHLGVTPRSVNDVSVRSLPSGAPASLADGIHVDSFGAISFTVLQAGQYSVRATDGSAVAVRSVFLSELTPYDITDPRSFAQYAPTVGEGVPGGGSGGVTDHGQLTGLGDDDHPQYLTTSRGDVRYQPSGSYAPETHTHTASQISDSTATGRSVLTAASQAAARTAIGAGTSNLTLGTTSTTAKAGDYQPSSAQISDATSVGRSLITAVDAAAARAAIGAGTGSGSVASTDITDSTAVGRSVLTAADAAGARTAIGAGTSSLTIGTTSSTAKAGDYQPTAANISDATSVGRSVITAADQAAARTAIGAGTSNLTIGTTSSTAKAGDYQPTAANISDSTATGRSVLTAASAAAARTAIGAGTSNLAVGTTASDAKAGNYTPPIADLPAGSVLYAVKPSGGSWPNRPTSRTDIMVIWVGASPAPSIVTSPAVNGAYEGDRIDLTA